MVENEQKESNEIEEQIDELSNNDVEEDEIEKLKNRVIYAFISGAIIGGCVVGAIVMFA